MTYVLLIAALLGGDIQARGIIVGFRDRAHCEAARPMADAMWIRSGAKAVAPVCLPVDEA